MRNPGAFKVSRRTGAEPSYLDPFGYGSSRTRKIVESLRDEILGGGENLRIRRIFEQPRSIYRIEIDVPNLNYQRTTLLDGDTLDELLEIDEIRSRLAAALQ